MIDYYQNQRIEQRKRRKLKIFSIIALVVFALIISGAIYFLHSNYSKIKNVSVSIDPQDNLLEASVLQSFQSAIGDSQSFFEKNLFGSDSIFSALINGGGISQSIGQDVPQISDVQVTTDIFSRNVKISAETRTRFGLWCFEGGQSASSTEGVVPSKCFWFDRDGTAFMEGPDTEGQLIYKVIDNYHQPVQLGQKIMEQDFMNNIVAMFNFLDNSGLGYKTIYLSDPKLEEASTDPNISPVVYFSLRNNPMYALDAFLNSKSTLTKANYIDLRIPNRIYYK